MTVKNYLPFYLIGLYPVALILGTLISEILTLFLIALYISDCIKDKKKFIFNDPIIYFLILIWFYLLFNLFLSIDFQLSLMRSIFFVRYPLLILAITHFLIKSPEKSQIIFTLWFYALTIIIIDLYIQFFFGKNILGYESPWDQRLSGFFNQELKVAHLLIGFFLPAFSFFFQKQKRNIFLYIALISYFIILILTNERSNIIKGSLILIIFAMMAPYFKIKIKILFSMILLGIFSLMIFFIQPLKSRFVDELSTMKVDNSLINYVILSNYGPHYLSSIEIFKNNKIFGTGIKTFRIACNDISIKKYYPNDDHRSKSGCSTHPHQTYFEILSDLGLTGFIIFSSFFLYLSVRIVKTFMVTKDLLLLSCGAFYITQLIPLLPTGSFFTSFGSTIFFINVSLIYYSFKKYE